MRVDREDKAISSSIRLVNEWGAFVAKRSVSTCKQAKSETIPLYRGTSELGTKENNP
ncbi:715_t:CDS:2, partial [Racocetra fulgida]